MAKRQRVGSLVWFTHISWAASSELSARAYCRSQGWSYSTFMVWRQRLCRELAGGALPFRAMGRR